MGLLDLGGELLEGAVGVGEEAGGDLAGAVGLKNTGEEETPQEKAAKPKLEAQRRQFFAKQKKGNRKGNAYTVGASMYGGPGDPSSGHVGSSGKDLTGTMSFAELGMGKFLGDLPYGTKLRITWREGGEEVPHTVVAEKLDIGLGGNPVTGKNVGDGKTVTKQRRIDLWYQTAKALNFKGTGLVQIERVDGKPIPGLGAPEEPYNVHTATYGTGNTTESEQPEPGKKVGALGFLGELTFKRVLLAIVALGLGAFALMWLSRDLTGGVPV